MKEFLLFGDSITQLGFDGWVASLADTYIRKADIINRGLSGYNTKNALAALPYILKDLSKYNNISLIIIFFGANDAAIEYHDVNRSIWHTNINEYTNNLHLIIKILKNKFIQTNPKFILITPPCIDEKMWLEEMQRRDPLKKFITSNRINQITMNYAQACINVGIKENIPTIDLFTKLNDPINRNNKYLSDGLHLSKIGNDIVYSEIQKVINTNYSDLKVDALKMYFPIPSEININHPEETMENFSNNYLLSQ